MDVYYYICQRLKLEGETVTETENMGVCTKERKGETVTETAEVLMARAVPGPGVLVAGQGGDTLVCARRPTPSAPPCSLVARSRRR